MKTPQTPKPPFFTFSLHAVYKFFTRPTVIHSILCAIVKTKGAPLIGITLSLLTLVLFAQGSWALERRVFQMVAPTAQEQSLVIAVDQQDNIHGAYYLQSPSAQRGLYYAVGKLPGTTATPIGTRALVDLAQVSSISI